MTARFFTNEPCIYCGGPLEAELFGRLGAKGEPSFVSSLPTNAALQSHPACDVWSQ